MAFSAGLDSCVIHVSSKYMQQEGTNGLFRGNQNQGVMKGIHMNNIIYISSKKISKAMLQLLIKQDRRYSDPKARNG